MLLAFQGMDNKSREYIDKMQKYSFGNCEFI